MIHVEQLNFAVGKFALRGVSLHVDPAEYFVLLGPSGSGKTLLIECLCGLNRIDSGRIWIGQPDVTRDVTLVEPRNRGVGYLPQDYALFPHRTVRGNIAFGLAKRRVPRAEICRQVDQLMQQLGVAHLADRLPRRLSGGEQQRVALARALAVRPRVLLLDEPVSALDEQTRDGLCRQLKQLQTSTRTTTVHVCHNFAEMLAVADRVGIISQGEILQVGTPQEILERPCTTQMAQFVQAGNLFSADARAAGDGIEVVVPGGVKFFAQTPESGSLTGAVSVMIRPENIQLSAARPDEIRPGSTILEGSVKEIVELGPVVKLRVACGAETELLASLGKREYNDRGVVVGDRVSLAVAPEDVHLMRE